MGSDRSRTFEEAAFAWKALSRGDKPRVWERSTSEVVRKLDGWLGFQIRRAGSRGAVERSDLFQVARVECLEALERWDPTKAKVTTYLKPFANGAQSRELRCHGYSVHLPEDRADRRRGYDQRAAMGDVSGCEPQACGDGWRHGRMDDAGDPGGENPWERLVGSDGREFEFELDRRRQRRDLAQRLLRLRAQDRPGSRRGFKLLWTNLVEGRSSRELGLAHGISHVRVQQIVHRGLDELRKTRSGGSKAPERMLRAMERRLEGVGCPSL